MINIKDIALEYLMPNLGVPKITYKQIKFDCPKCGYGYNKKNLEISTEYYVFNCWSCHYKGYITKLLKEYATSDSWKQISEFKTIYNNQKTNNELVNKIDLPKSIIPFYLKKEVEKYLVEERKIDKNLLIERKVGYIYSEDETLYNHIIFPFYDLSGENIVGFSVQNLSTKKYKNFGKRNFIPYGEFINVNYPITLTEGIYDALSGYNAIPLLGTDISKAILNFLVNKNVILAVDNEVSKEEKKKLTDKLKKYCVNLIYLFDTFEYKDLNKFKQEDKNRLILNYKTSIETIFENL